jgi:hypothetical protein
LADEKNPKKIHNTTESHRLFLMIPTQNKLLKLAHTKTGNTTRLPIEVLLSRKKKPETNKKTVATRHETQDNNNNNNTHHKPLQGQSAPQNLMRERKKYLFH